MKFAAPLKMNKQESAITKVLGKAKYFGIYDSDGETIEIIQNTQAGGPAIFYELKRLGVDVVLTQHAGPGAVRAADELGIELFYCGDERKNIFTAIKEFEEGECIKITPQNFHQFH
jgi:predicted Fe-Mo cluster-binding NifX family protein